MAVTVIDKIKQKNSGTFKLLDAVDINGQITGWQNPVKNIYHTPQDIPSVALGDSFIIESGVGTFPTYCGKDIYGNTVAAVNNGIYIVVDAVPDGEQFPVALLTAPGVGMVVLNKTDATLKVYSPSSSWINLTATPGGTISGQSLRYAEELSVSIGTNYNATTKHLTIGTALQTGDNVNVYLNGLKYSHIGSYNAFTFSSGDSILVWIPGNAGFDLVDDDYIEIEIFNIEN
jgi:hypothetical protein